MTRQQHPNNTTHRAKAHQGFTLVELMITIAIMGIIAAMAGPSMNRAIANQRVKSTATTIESALSQAKVESAIRRKDIIVELSSHTLTVTEGTNQIARYELNSRSEISPDSTTTPITVTFSPTPRASAETTYTICDSASLDEVPVQVSTNTAARITMKQAGTCS